MSTSLASSAGIRRSVALRRQFAEVRALTLRLTQGLSAEDQMLQSMPEASPTKWHLAHTTWFFETFILEPHAAGYRSFEPRFKYLFNSYYKQLGAHPYRGARGLMSRPSLEQVREFRRHVDAAVERELVQGSDAVLDLVELGVHHEQQHQELILTDIRHALWSAPLRPEYGAGRPSQSAVKMEWLEIPGGRYAVGHAGDGFAFDNESPRHHVLLLPFRLASRLVTNGEYLEFMLDGGYRRPELWLSDGWETVCAQQWQAPLYWERSDDGTWWQFDGRTTMSGVAPDEPVCHISYYEADAYARWAGARLPAEPEWEAVAERHPARGTLLDGSVLHPRPAQGSGMQQILGDVWEWTASPYIGYPGFRPAPGLVGEYNGKFMCNQMVLRGGSCATPASHIRSSYRNFFPPAARWQFSGVRLAHDCP